MKIHFTAKIASEFFKLAIVLTHFISLNYVLFYFQMYGPKDFLSRQQFQIYSTFLSILTPLIYYLSGFNIGKEISRGMRPDDKNIDMLQRVAMSSYVIFFTVSYLNSLFRDQLRRPQEVLPELYSFWQCSSCCSCSIGGEPISQKNLELNQ
jgi:hypothetical protein